MMETHTAMRTENAARAKAGTVHPDSLCARDITFAYGMKGSVASRSRSRSWSQVGERERELEDSQKREVERVRELGELGGSRGFVQPGESRGPRRSRSTSAHLVLDHVSLPPCEPGTVTALLGPNGCGKSTLLRCLAGLERCEGEITGPKPLYLPQDPPPRSALTVFESVLLAHQQKLQGFAGFRVSSTATARVREVLDSLGLSDLANRRLGELSGGQRQMVSCAQALIREPTILLLDEPTSALDLKNQLSVLQWIREYAITTPAAVVIAIHDITQASRFSDSAIILHDGHLVASGAPEDVITSEMLASVYQVEARIHREHGGVAIDPIAPLH